MTDGDSLANSVGIVWPDPERARLPVVYFRSAPSDFVVEGEPGTSAPVPCAAEVNASPFFDARTRGPRLWSLLVQTGFGTDEAIRRLGYSDVDHAGRKDSRGITAQWLSIGDAPLHSPAPVRVEDHHRRAVCYPVLRTRQRIGLGESGGNRFTVILRSPCSDDLTRFVDLAISSAGSRIWNFVGPQRFGSRLHAHRLALALLRGSMQEIVPLLIGESRPWELAQVRVARAVGHAALMRGDFGAVIASLKSVGNTALERDLHSLAAISRVDSTHSLRATDAGVRDWLDAYFAWLHNRLISQIARRTRVDDRVPFPWTGLALDPAYHSLVGEDGLDAKTVADVVRAVMGERRATGRRVLRYTHYQCPRVQLLERADDAATVRFLLPPGAFANVFLAHFGRVLDGAYHHLPRPDRRSLSRSVGKD